MGRKRLDGVILTGGVHRLDVVHVESVQAKRLLVHHVLEASLLLGGAPKRVRFAHGARLETSGNKRKQQQVGAERERGNGSKIEPEMGRGARVI